MCHTLHSLYINTFNIIVIIISLAEKSHPKSSPGKFCGHNSLIPLFGPLLSKDISSVLVPSCPHYIEESSLGLWSHKVPVLPTQQGHYKSPDTISQLTNTQHILLSLSLSCPALTILIRTYRQRNLLEFLGAKNGH